MEWRDYVFPVVVVSMLWPWVAGLVDLVCVYFFGSQASPIDWGSDWGLIFSLWPLIVFLVAAAIGVVKSATNSPW